VQEYNETVLQLFIDFKKAYDSVRKEVFENVLMEFGDLFSVVGIATSYGLDDRGDGVRVPLG
jgi:hypothetical protein